MPHTCHSVVTSLVSCAPPNLHCRSPRCRRQTNVSQLFVHHFMPGHADLLETSISRYGSHFSTFMSFLSPLWLSNPANVAFYRQVVS